MGIQTLRTRVRSGLWGEGANRSINPPSPADVKASQLKSVAKKVANTTTTKAPAKTTAKKTAPAVKAAPTKSAAKKASTKSAAKKTTAKK